MRLLRKLSPGGSAGAGFVATIGGFDGIHLGHRLLIERTRVQARERGLRSMVVSFEPLPKEFFAPENLRPALPVSASAGACWRRLGRTCSARCVSTNVCAA